MPSITIIAIIVLVIFFLSASLKILNEYERGVIFRLGRVIKAKGPGLIILIPIIDKMVRVSLRLVVMDVDPQDVITRDNVSVKVNAVIYFRVIDSTKAIIEVGGAVIAQGIKGVSPQHADTVLCMDADRIPTAMSNYNI